MEGFPDAGGERAGAVSAPLVSGARRFFEFVRQEKDKAASA